MQRTTFIHVVAAAALVVSAEASGQVSTSASQAPIDLSPYPEVQRWRAAIAARPATGRAYALATQVNPDAGKPMSEEQKKVLFGQGPR